LKQTRVSLVG